MSVPKESTKLIDKLPHEDEEDTYALRWAAWGLALATFIILCTLGTLSFYFSLDKNATAAFALGLLVILDGTTSLVVVWRFTGPDSQQKENTACVILAILFYLLFIVIAFKSIWSLETQSMPEKSEEVFIVEVFIGCVAIILGLSKLYVAYRLKSISVLTDGLTTIMDFIVASTGLLLEYVCLNLHRACYMESVLGIIVAVILFSYGTWVIVHQIKSSKMDSSDDDNTTD